MNEHAKRRRRKPHRIWPQKVKAEGSRVSVTVYRRTRASGRNGYQVANWTTRKRVLESFDDEQSALDRAEDLSRAQSTRQVLAGTVSNEEVAQLLAAKEKLTPLGLMLLPTVEAAAQAVSLTGSLANLLKATEDYARRHAVNVTPKPVADAVREFIAERRANGCSTRYVQDLTSRLGRFARSFKCDIGSVKGEAVQTWLDTMKVGLLA